MPTPRLWYFSSVKFAPTWQAVQFPLVPKKMSRPRLALSDIGCSSASFLIRQIFLIQLGIVVLQIVEVDAGERPQLLFVIIRRRASDQRPLERGDGLGHVVDRQFAEDGLEFRLIDRALVDRRHALLVGVAHLDRIGDRADGLHLPANRPGHPKTACR